MTEETFERTTQAGWTVASSDGLGSLVPTRQVLLPGEDILILGIAGGDLDGMGLSIWPLVKVFRLELWHNRGEDGFETILQLSDVFFAGLADGDGDGDVDLLVRRIDPLRDDSIVRSDYVAQ